MNRDNANMHIDVISGFSFVYTHKSYITSSARIKLMYNYCYLSTRVIKLHASCIYKKFSINVNGLLYVCKLTWCIYN